MAPFMSWLAVICSGDDACVNFLVHCTQVAPLNEAVQAGGLEALIQQNHNPAQHQIMYQTQIHPMNDESSHTPRKLFDHSSAVNDTSSTKKRVSQSSISLFTQRPIISTEGSPGSTYVKLFQFKKGSLMCEPLNNSLHMPPLHHHTDLFPIFRPPLHATTPPPPHETIQDTHNETNEFAVDLLTKRDDGTTRLVFGNVPAGYIR
jgi:hypothetical protein